MKFTEVLAHMKLFLPVLWFDVTHVHTDKTHTGHKGPIDWRDVFDFQKLFTCRSHVSADLIQQDCVKQIMLMEMA